MAETFTPPPLPKKKIKLQKDKVPLETDIEIPVCTFATKKLGMYCVKFGGGSIGQRSQPDRIYIMDGFTFYIEFKRPKKAATPAQVLIHKKMRDKGAVVYVVDSIADGRAIATYHFLGGRSHYAGHPRTLPVYNL